MLQVIGNVCPGDTVEFTVGLFNLIEFVLDTTCAFWFDPLETKEPSDTRKARPRTRKNAFCNFIYNINYINTNVYIIF